MPDHTPSTDERASLAQPSQSSSSLECTSHLGLGLAIVFAEMERGLARERTVAGLERVKATGKHLGRRKGVSRRRAEEIQNMRQRDGLSWSRIATITGLPSSSIRRICTWDLEEIAPTAFGEG